MNSRTTLRTLGFAALLTAGSILSTQAALTITLHPDGNGGTMVEISGSGTTGADAISQFTNSTAEQWLNMTGDPFDPELDNSDHYFTTSIPFYDGVNIIGIQVDSDNVGPDEDDLRIYLDAIMTPNTPYNVAGLTTLTTPLAHDSLNIGSYTDDDDGATAFLGGFTLVIDNNVVPEPSTALLSFLACGTFVLRRKRA